MPSKALVLDANTLIRAVLGQRVRRVLEAHADAISFFIPETAYANAEEHLVALREHRNPGRAAPGDLLNTKPCVSSPDQQSIWQILYRPKNKRLLKRPPKLQQADWD